jgi:hypothetical protein
LRQRDEWLAGQEAVPLDLGPEGFGQLGLTWSEGRLEQLEVLGAEVAGDQERIRRGYPSRL